MNFFNSIQQQLDQYQSSMVKDTTANNARNQAAVGKIIADIKAPSTPASEDEENIASPVDWNKVA